MYEILDAFTDEARTGANEENLFGLFESLVSWPRIQVTRDSICVRTLSDVASVTFNSVLGARLSEANLDATVAGILAPYRDCAVPALWWVGPSSRPAKLGAALERNRLSPLPALHGMSLKLEPLALHGVRPPGLRIERVFDRDTADDWSRALAGGMGLAPSLAAAWRDGVDHTGYGPFTTLEHWVGYLDGTPSACSSLFRCAGVAGIYNVTTLPRARGRGLGAALLRAALAEARTEGFRLAVTQAAPDALSLFAGIGFRQDFRIDRYVWNPESAGTDA